MLNNRIRKLRDEQNISQINLSMKLEVSQETISAYELGKHFPTVSKLILMSKLFHASIDYILGLSMIRLPEKEEFTDVKEMQLMDLFHQLNDVKKQKVISYAEGLLDSQN